MKKYILLFIIFLIVINITYGFKEKGPFTLKETFAFYVKSDDGEYVISEDQKLPTVGYILNEEKSTCKNGGVVKQNAENKSLNLSTSLADSCKLYFNIEPLIKNISFDVETKGSAAFGYYNKLTITSIETSHKNVSKYHIKLLKYNKDGVPMIEEDFDSIPYEKDLSNLELISPQDEFVKFEVYYEDDNNKSNVYVLCYDETIGGGDCEYQDLEPPDIEEPDIEVPLE